MDDICSRVGMFSRPFPVLVYKKTYLHTIYITQNSRPKPAEILPTIKNRYNFRWPEDSEPRWR